MNLNPRSILAGAFALLAVGLLNVRAETPATPDRAAALADAKAGRWEQAEPALAVLAAADPADADACAQLAQRRLQQHRSKEAVELLERAVAAAPTRPDLHSQLGQALAQRIGEVSFIQQAMIAGRMRSAFEKSVALDPNHVPGLIGLSRYFMNSPAIAGGSLEKADEFATKVEKLDPFDGVLSHGLIRERAEKWAEAADFYRQALAMQGQHAWLHTMLGSALARAGQKDEARTAFEAALKLQPDNPQARDGLAALAK
jgi:Flp pilus assembly protein TadD